LVGDRDRRRTLGVVADAAPREGDEELFAGGQDGLEKEVAVVVAP
jgi:hypothetical protein